MLKDYRRRGVAEDVFGEFKSTIGTNLSSTNRPKQSYAGIDVNIDNKYNFNPCLPFQVNQANLLLLAYSYETMHCLRICQELKTQKGWSLHRIREQLLKWAAKVTQHSRQVFFYINRHTSKFLSDFLNTLSILDIKRYPEETEVQRC